MLCTPDTAAPHGSLILVLLSTPPPPRARSVYLSIYMPYFAVPDNKTRPPYHSFGREHLPGGGLFLECRTLETHTSRERASERKSNTKIRTRLTELKLSLKLKCLFISVFCRCVMLKSRMYSDRYSTFARTKTTHEGHARRHARR